MSQHSFEIPDLDAPIADTHAHLDMLEDPAGALARAGAAGLVLVVTVVDPTEEPEATITQLPRWLDEAAARLAAEGSTADPPVVRIIVGVHPHNAKDVTEKTYEAMARLLADPLVVGVGEIGLDYHYDHSPRDVQARVFARQLALAREHDLPAIVHLREAHEDGETVLSDEGPPAAGCVLHCFTGDRPLLERFLGLGCLVSFAGPVTFKKADAIREAARATPIHRLLVETDCPFMAPEPYRGRKNEPALSVFNALRIAQARGLPADELASATTANAFRVFGGAR